MNKVTRIIGGIVIVGTMILGVFVADPTIIELQFDSASGSILFNDSIELPINSYSYDARFDTYYVHWEDGEQTYYEGAWDTDTVEHIRYFWNVAKGEEDTRIVVNSVQLTEVFITGTQYNALYKNPITKELTKEVLTKEEYEDSEVRRKPKKLMFGGNPVNAAIAIGDTSTSTDGSWSFTMTMSHVVSGSNTVLACINSSNSTSTSTDSMIFNGTDHMATATDTWNSSNKITAAFTFIAPSDGTHDIISTWSGGRNDRSLHCLTLTGADQDSQPECTGFFDSYPAGTTDFSLTACNTSSSENAIGLESYLGQGTSDTHTIVTPDATINYEDVVAVFSIYGGTELSTTTSGDQIHTWQNSAAFSGTSITVMYIDEAAADVSRRVIFPIGN